MVVHLRLSLECQDSPTHINGRCIDVKLLEDGESFLVELAANADVGNVRNIVVVQAVDVLAHPSIVSLHSSQDQHVLQVAAQEKNSDAKE